MTEQEFRKLRMGDLILRNDGEVGYVCGFGRLRNGRWIRSSREECNGVRIWNPRLDGRSYRVRTSLRKLLLTKQEILMLAFDVCWLRMPRDTLEE